MKARVFIIHGWGGRPDEGWLLWLKEKLEKKGIEVEAPLMPSSEAPEIERWVSYLENLVGIPDENIFFVGYSIGVQTILRYLEKIDTQVGGVLAVAGFYAINNAILISEEDKQIAKPWIETPIDSAKLRKNIKKITAIFSDDDPIVPLKNTDYFKERLGAEIIIVKGRGHDVGGNNAKDYSLILDELLKFIGNEL